MSISKKFYSLVLAILAVFALVGCNIGGNGGNTTDPEPVEGITLSDAQALVNKAIAKIGWSETDLTVTADLTFATSNSFAPGVVISWASSNEDVIALDGKVTRPTFGQGNATVTVTATYSMAYNLDDNGNTVDEVYSDTESWTFTVVEAGEVFNIARIKEKIVAGEIETGTEVTFTGVIVAKIAKANGNQIIVYDGSEGLYVHTASDLEVGTKVQVSGTVDIYYEIYQIKNGAQITVVEENVELPTVEKTTIADHAALGKDNGVVGGRLVNVDAIVDVSVEASYTNVYLVDPVAGAKFLVYYKTEYTYMPNYTAEMADYIATLQAYDGKTINITVAQYDLKDNDNRMCLTPYPITEVAAVELTDEEKAEFILNGINIPTTVTTALTLPAEEGLTWAVKEGTGITIAEGVATVTPTTEVQTVVLTATATVNQVVLTKDFTISVAAQLPEPTQTTIADLVANKPTADKAEVYVVTGIWTLDAGKETYGNGKLADEAGNTITIYGLCKSDSVLSHDGSVYVFKNDKSYTSIGINDGAVIKVGMIYTLQFDNYSAYIIEIVSTGEAPVHEHVACPTCGLCTDLACDGTAEEKCAGHAVVENGVMELNVTSLGLTNGSYAAGTTTVDSVSFEYIELGYYTNGIQMRNKNGNRSQLWNTTAFAGAISKIELTYNSAKSTYDNDSVLIFTFGNAVGEATYTTSLSTVAGQSTYTITPDAAYTYFKLEQNESYTYSMYWDSIVVYYEGGQGSDPVVPEPSVHEHVACPTCGLCTAADCDGAADVKCAGHEAVTPSVVTSIAEALAAAPGTAVELTGTVSGIYQAYNSQYGNVSVYIKDANENVILAFRMKGTGAETLSVGDTIKVTGTVVDYNGTNQVDAGCTFEMITVHTCDYTEPTCKAPATCTLCKVAKDDVLGEHNFVEEVCTVCGASNGATEVETQKVTMKYSGSTTTNMTGNNDAEKLGLDASIFTVTGDKNGGQNNNGLNKNGYIALYSVRASGEGTILTIKIAEGYTIQSITVSWGTGSNGTATFTVNGVESTKATTDYVINGNEIVIKNTFCDPSASKNAQLWINSIEITYFAN